ncbi:MAG: hypothetical protein IKY45_01230 [Clostridia bacterium]|nr:hypothetical protein [Clostridia bacterium]
MRIYDNGIYREMTEEEILQLKPTKETQIEELKQKLADTDYIACKIAEGAATKEEYIDLLRQRELWRIEINNLEKSRSDY